MRCEAVVLLLSVAVALGRHCKDRSELKDCQNCSLPRLDIRDCPETGFDCFGSWNDKFSVSNGPGRDDCDELTCEDEAAVLFVHGKDRRSLVCTRRTWRYGYDLDKKTSSAVCGKSCIGKCDASVPAKETSATRVSVRPPCNGQPCAVAYCHGHLKLAGYLVGGPQTAKIADRSARCSGSGTWIDESGKEYTAVFCLHESGSCNCPPGAPGHDGAKGDTGSPGATGPKGATGNPGSPGATGATGPAGPKGATGNTGSPGATGATGNPGSPGATGATGPTGPKGATGNNGSPGATGATGNPGSPGATGNTGPKGETGNPGSPGATGTTGPKGEIGNPGSPGATGTTGPKGETGNPGSPGATGTTGPKGETGNPGSPGATGTTGPKGETGNPGSPGATGASGPPGPKGETGAKGEKGSDGAAGLKGDKGDAGEKGSDGAAGLKGDKGDAGEKGSDGAAGQKGDKGDAGEKGSDGAAGLKGDKGDTGEKGSKGDTGVGTPGAKGEKGDTGVGVKGEPGTNGSPGAKGETGLPGPPGECCTACPIINSIEETVCGCMPGFDCVRLTPDGSTTTFVDCKDGNIVSRTLTGTVWRDEKTAVAGCSAVTKKWDELILGFDPTRVYACLKPNKCSGCKQDMGSLSTTKYSRPNYEIDSKCCLVPKCLTKYYRSETGKGTATEVTTAQQPLTCAATNLWTPPSGNGWQFVVCEKTCTMPNKMQCSTGYDCYSEWKIEQKLAGSGYPGIQCYNSNIFGGATPNASPLLTHGGGQFKCYQNEWTNLADHKPIGINVWAFCGKVCATNCNGGAPSGKTDAIDDMINGCKAKTCPSGKTMYSCTSTSCSGGEVPVTAVTQPKCISGGWRVDNNGGTKAFLFCA